MLLTSELGDMSLDQWFPLVHLLHDLITNSLTQCLDQEEIEKLHMPGEAMNLICPTIFFVLPPHFCGAFEIWSNTVGISDNPYNLRHSQKFSYSLI